MSADGPGGAFIHCDSKPVFPPSCTLSPAARNSVLRFRLDRPASVAQVAAHLFAYGAAYVLGKCGQCLPGGSAAAFKGTIIGVE